MSHAVAALLASPFSSEIGDNPSVALNPCHYFLDLMKATSVFPYIDSHRYIFTLFFWQTVLIQTCAPSTRASFPDSCTMRFDLVNEVLAASTTVA